MVTLSEYLAELDFDYKINDNNIDDIDSFIPYSVRLIEAMKLLPKKFDTNYIQLITDICNYNIDISELF